MACTCYCSFMTGIHWRLVHKIRWFVKYKAMWCFIIDFVKSSRSLLYPSTTKLLGDILVSLCPSVHPSICRSIHPACHVCSVTPAVLDGFFPYWAQMVTSIRRCVVHNDLGPWPISSRSFSHDFAIRLLKYGISCHVRSTAHTVLDEFFTYLAQMITSMRGCVACNDLLP